MCLDFYWPLQAPSPICAHCRQVCRLELGPGKGSNRGLALDARTEGGRDASQGRTRYLQPRARENFSLGSRT
jgi:hypothetical protein